MMSVCLTIEDSVLDLTIIYARPSLFMCNYLCFSAAERLGINFVCRSTLLDDRISIQYFFCYAVKVN